jgi:hypothetical protein
MASSLQELVDMLKPNFNITNFNDQQTTGIAEVHFFRSADEFKAEGEFPDYKEILVISDQDNKYQVADKDSLTISPYPFDKLMVYLYHILPNLNISKIDPNFLTNKLQSIRDYLEVFMEYFGTNPSESLFNREDANTVSYLESVQKRSLALTDRLRKYSDDLFDRSQNAEFTKTAINPSETKDKEIALDTNPFSVASNRNSGAMR